MTEEGGEVVAMEGRLRDLIFYRDALARELDKMERHIAEEARAYATATGITVRPTVPQLRRQLWPEGTPGAG